MPLNHAVRFAYLLFQVVMVAFPVMMVAFSAKGRSIQEGFTTSILIPKRWFSR